VGLFNCELMILETQQAVSYYSLGVELTITTMHLHSWGQNLLYPKERKY
jgi:hypothetical protein